MISLKILWIIASSVLLVSAKPNSDPEANMTAPEIVRYWGYPCEVHHVTTQDGYILEMHRIPYGKVGKSKNFYVKKSFIISLFDLIGMPFSHLIELNKTLTFKASSTTPLQYLIDRSVIFGS